MNFTEVWGALESSAGPPGGYIKRRVPTDRFDVFIAVEKPSNHRMLLLHVDESSTRSLGRLPSTRGVAVRIIRPADDGRDAAVQLVLAEPRYNDIFAALASDIAAAVASKDTEMDAVQSLLGQLARWQSFLQSALTGLGEDAQRGLYGELWFLRRHLLDGPAGIEVAVRSWRGPEEAHQDFQLRGRAVEVKTTAGKQHQRILIASERQLDDTGIDVLLLFHLSVDVREGSGESLPLLIDAVRERLDGHGGAAEVFESQLMRGGYHDSHRSRYDQAGYTARETNLFKVEAGFPRIVEADLKSGVGDVRYSIAVSECRRFQVPVGRLPELVFGGNQ